MPRESFRVTSRRIQREKSTKYIGVARVKISALKFPGARDLDAKNVERLKNLFRGQGGCKPDDVQNRIPAIIDDATLGQALSVSGLSRQALLSPGPDYPRLDFPANVHLKCLRGQHRVKAAGETFTSTDISWAVDLFIADISDEAKRDLVEEYANENRPNDGEFYYKIRQYQGVFGQVNPSFKRQWWARLAAISKRGSTNLRDRLEQLLGHRKFAPAFDAFRHLPALYCGLRLSAVNKMTAMKCDEVNETPLQRMLLLLNSQELLSYLRHIKDFWYFVFDRNESDMEKLDAASVEALESQAPGACDAEARSLYGRVCAGEIFSAFSSQQRQALWAKVCSATVDYLIPSLSGFFDDINHLKLVADSVKLLLRPSGRETVRSVFELSFSHASDDDAPCLVQTSSSSFRSVPGRETDRFDVAYRVLWLYALREYQEIPAETEHRLAGPKSAQANEKVLVEFASLAHRLGFRSEKIEDLLQRDADRDIAQRLLTTARPLDRFQYPDLEGCVAEVTDLIRSAQAIHDRNATEDSLEEPGGPKRNGIPRLSDYKRDRPYLFLDRMHGPIRCGVSVTSLFIQRSAYFTFFGKQLSVETTSVDQGADAIDQPSLDLDQEQLERRQPMSTGVGQRDRVESLSRLADEQEARLEQLTQREREQQENITRHRNELSEEEERLAASRRDGQELQQKLEGLRRAEEEQVLRLDGLKADEEERRNAIGALEQRKRGLDGEIRLDLVAAGQREQAINNEEAQMTRLEQLSDAEKESQGKLDQLRAEADERQGRLDQLAIDERHKNASIQQLEGEEQRLRAVVAELLDKARQAEQTWGKKEEEHSSVVDRLVAKELELRGQIDQLEVCLKRLQEETDETADDEGESRLRLERAVAEEARHALATIEESQDEGGEHERDTAELFRIDSDEGSEPQATPDGLGESGEHAARQTKQEQGGAGQEQQGLPAEHAAARLASPSEQVEQISEERGEGPQGDKISVAFKFFENEEWRLRHTLTVKRSDPSEVERVVYKYMWKGYGAFDIQNRALTPETCFERVTCDGSNTVHLALQWSLDGGSHDVGEVESSKRSRLEPG